MPPLDERTFRDACFIADIPPEDILPNYRGPGMAEGATCPAVVVDDLGLLITLGGALAALTDALAESLGATACFDDMGRRTVVYFPSHQLGSA